MQQAAERRDFVAVQKLTAKLQQALPSCVSAGRKVGMLV